MGNLWEFRRDPLGFLSGLARDYGDVARFRLGGKSIVQVNHPDLIREILVTSPENYCKTGVLERAKSVLGEGLVTADGEFHRRQRRLMQPAFSRQRILSFDKVFVSTARQVGDEWRTDTPIDLFHEMSRLTLGIITRALFSVELDSLAHQVEQALGIVLEHFQRLLISPLTRLTSHLPTPHTFRFQKARRLLDRIVYDMIADRRKSGGGQDDMMDRLISAQDDLDHSAVMTDRQIRDEVMTLLTAGHETIATGLTWTWYCLSQNPKSEALLHEEIDRVLDGCTPTADDLPRLVYTEMALAESMRLFPPVWGMTRRAISDHRLGGFQIPKGTILGLSQFVTHRDGRFFPEPLVFDPMRWTPAEREKRPKYAYFPFGGGPRVCIGEPFAWTEGILVLAALAQKWRIKIVEDQSLQLEPFLTLRPRQTLKAVLEYR